MDISIMIKPASSDCNLRCRYCFYHDLSSRREMASRGHMSEATLENVIKKAFEFAGDGRVMLSFQGGEPLLAGKPFFYSLHELIRKYNERKTKVFIGVQTNGTLIDEEWCGIFKRGGYLVGLSLDGDRLANEDRIDAGGNETFDKVFSAAKLMQKMGVDFNILTVLTKKISERIEEIYAFFSKNKFKFLQFIPMLKPLRIKEDGSVDLSPNDMPFPSYEDDLSLSSDDYANFLNKCFNLYLRDIKTHNYTSIRQFDNFVKLVNHEPADQCGMEGHCSHQFVIEGDGEVYPCDFFCLDKYDLGNINETDFYSLSRSSKMTDFIKESFVIKDECKECEFFRLCGNGCKRERIDIEKCAPYKEFFRYAVPYMKNIR
ncbi:MAG: SPASM domain-containing protein [Clostridia bacterium]|nr:SPASM domain-containing protein [Clostridia bacterium]